MIRYSEGMRQRWLIASAMVRWVAKRSWGRLSGYPVFRPPVDHSLYALDNARLGSTDRAHGRVYHVVSWQSEVSLPSIVEFEHAFALIGHTDERTDLVRFREEVAPRLSRFAAWMRSGPHRLIAASDGAAASLAGVLARTGQRLPAGRLSVVRWATAKRRGARRTHRDRLRVFHYGGAYPFSKGTHDVVEVARRLPGVSFTVSVEPGHRAISGAPANVIVHPYKDRRAYDRSLDEADVVLHPVYADGWGIVLDALSRALPIVVYDSYDKREAVSDGVTGAVVPLPSALSWYDGFFAGQYRTWDEYNEFVAGSQEPSRVEALAARIAAYDSDRRLLSTHSDNASRWFDERHAPAQRIARMKALYRELLAEIGT